MARAIPLAMPQEALDGKVNHLVARVMMVIRVTGSNTRARKVNYLKASVIMLIGITSLMLVRGSQCPHLDHNKYTTHLMDKRYKCLNPRGCQI